MVQVKVIKKANTETTKVKKVVIRKPSMKQQKALANLLENGGNKRQALRDAGYSEAMAKNPQKVFESVALNPEVNEIVNKYQMIREKIFNALLNRDFDKETTVPLSILLKDATNAIELLSGRPTDIQGHMLPEGEKERLKRIINENRS